MHTPEVNFNHNGTNKNYNFVPIYTQLHRYSDLGDFFFSSILLFFFFSQLFQVPFSEAELL